MSLEAASLEQAQLPELKPVVRGKVCRGKKLGVLREPTLLGGVTLRTTFVLGVGKLGSVTPLGRLLKNDGGGPTTVRVPTPALGALVGVDVRIGALVARGVPVGLLEVVSRGVGATGAGVVTGVVTGAGVAVARAVGVGVLVVLLLPQLTQNTLLLSPPLVDGADCFALSS